MVLPTFSEEPKHLSMKDKVHLNMQRQLDSLQTDRPYSAMKTNRSSSRLPHQKETQRRKGYQEPSVAYSQKLAESHQKSRVSQIDRSCFTSLKKAVKEDKENHHIGVQDARQLKELIQSEITRLQMIYQSIDKFLPSPSQESSKTTLESHLYSNF